MAYDKPKVTIDLDEYLELKSKANESSASRTFYSNQEVFIQPMHGPKDRYISQEIISDENGTALMMSGMLPLVIRFKK